jgi:HEAT repeat protein
MTTEQALTNDLLKGELEAAKGTVTGFLNVLKTYALYSEYHPFCEQVVTRFHGNLVSFLEEYGNFVLTVKRHRLLYEEKEVHSGPSNEENIAFSFFRDGIELIEMIEGIELWETKAIVKIVHKHKRLSEEPEGDLVTAFWEAQLPHFHYEATEYIPEENLEGSGFSQKTFIGGKTESADKVNLESLSLKNLRMVDSPPGKLFSHDNDPVIIDSLSIDLTSQEVDALHKIVAQEEDQDPTQEIVAMLVDIMHNQEDTNYFLLSLDFMKESLEESFIARNFTSALTILQSITYIRVLYQKDRPWALPYIDDFLIRVPKQESFSVVQQALSDTECPHLGQIEQIILLLNPEVIASIAPILSAVSTEATQGMLRKVVTSLAARDITPLEAILKDAPDDLLVILIGILGQLQGDRPIQLLMELSHHSSEIVRKVVLRTLIMREVWDPENLFSMIDDPSKYIRKTLINYLLSRKCERTEQLFINYLTPMNTSGSNDEHILACFKALGLCGSHRSIPVLSEMLLRGSLLSKIAGSVTRRGAAIALHSLGKEDAEQILIKAAKSFYPGIRRASLMVSKN